MAEATSSHDFTLIEWRRIESALRSELVDTWSIIALLRNENAPEQAVYLLDKRAHELNKLKIAAGKHVSELMARKG